MAHSDIFQHCLTSTADNSHIVPNNSLLSHSSDASPSADDKMDDNITNIESSPSLSIDIDGGLQRALLLMYDDLNILTQNNQITKANIPKQKQKHKTQKYRRPNKIKLNLSNNNAYLTKLRQSLPIYPNKLIKQYKYQKNINMNKWSYIPNITPNLNDINAIRQQIIELENELNKLKNYEKMEKKIRNWKLYKLYWKNWKLIDFYSYLIRINDGFYMQYINDYNLFYKQWIFIVKNDTESRYENYDKTFNGNLLLLIDMNDLQLLGIKNKKDRKNIMKKIYHLRRK